MKRSHWHKFNPWRERVVYVPIERLAECAAGGTIIDHKGNVKPYDVAFILAHWRQGGKSKLDAYILPSPDGRHSLGVRFGRQGSEYYSPHNANPALTQALLDEVKP